MLANTTSIVRLGASHALAALLMLSVGALLVGCGEQSIGEREVEKGVETVPPAEAEPAPATDDTGSNGAPGGPSWSLPDGWVLDPAPRPMRLATYMVEIESGAVEIAITQFPGTVGGELANINRWRGQMGLAPVDAAGLDATRERFTADGSEGYTTRLESDRGVMLAAAVYETAEGHTWFVRTTTTVEGADAVEEDLFAFAKAIVAGDG